MNPIWRTLTLFVFFTAALVASEPKPMTNADVVSMVKAELPETTVILAIQKGSAGFDTTPQALIALKSNGVSPKIIEAMITQPSHLKVSALKEDKNPPPSEEVVKKQFESMAEQQSSGVVTVVAFKKTNGQLSSQNGIPIYTMTFDLTVSFSQSCIWRNVTFDPKLTFMVAQQATGTGTQAILQMGMNPGMDVSRGTAFLIKGEARFEKMEQGWRSKEILRKEFRRVNATEVRLLEQAATTTQGNAVPEMQEKVIPESPGRTMPQRVPALTAADLAGFLPAQRVTPTIPSSGATSSQNGKITANLPASYVLEDSGSDAEIRMVIRNPDGLKDIIRVVCKPTALLNRNPSIESVVTAWRNEDIAKNPRAIASDAVSALLLEGEARQYAVQMLQEGRIRQNVCTMVVAKKHIISVTLNAEPETVKARLRDYQQVCESLVLHVK